MDNTDVDYAACRELKNVRCLDTILAVKLGHHWKIHFCESPFKPTRGDCTTWKNFIN